MIRYLISNQQRNVCLRLTNLIKSSTSTSSCFMTTIYRSPTINQSFNNSKQDNYNIRNYNTKSSPSHSHSNSSQQQQQTTYINQLEDSIYNNCRANALYSNEYIDKLFGSLVLDNEGVTMIMKSLANGENVTIHQYEEVMRYAVEYENFKLVDWLASMCVNQTSTLPLSLMQELFLLYSNDESTDLYYTNTIVFQIILKWCVGNNMVINDQFKLFRACLDIHQFVPLYIFNRNQSFENHPNYITQQNNHHKESFTSLGNYLKQQPQINSSDKIFKLLDQELDRVVYQQPIVLNLIFHLFKSNNKQQMDILSEIVHRFSIPMTKLFNNEQQQQIFNLEQNPLLKTIPIQKPNNNESSSSSSSSSSTIPIIIDDIIDYNQLIDILCKDYFYKGFIPNNLGLYIDNINRLGIKDLDNYVNKIRSVPFRYRPLLLTSSLVTELILRNKLHTASQIISYTFQVDLKPVLEDLANRQRINIFLEFSNTLTYHFTQSDISYATLQLLEMPKDILAENAGEILKLVKKFEQRNDLTLGTKFALVEVEFNVSMSRNKYPSLDTIALYMRGCDVKYRSQHTYRLMFEILRHHQKQNALSFKELSTLLSINFYQVAMVPQSHYHTIFQEILKSPITAEHGATLVAHLRSRSYFFKSGSFEREFLSSCFDALTIPHVKREFLEYIACLHRPISLHQNLISNLVETLGQSSLYILSRIPSDEMPEFHISVPSYISSADLNFIYNLFKK